MFQCGIEKQIRKEQKEVHWARHVVRKSISKVTLVLRRRRVSHLEKQQSSSSRQPSVTVVQISLAQLLLFHFFFLKEKPNYLQSFELQKSGSRRRMNAFSFCTHGGLKKKWLLASRSTSWGAFFGNKSEDNLLKAFSFVVLYM